MVLFIEDPDVKRMDGKHFTLKYEIPRNTTRIDVKTIQPKDASQVETSNRSESDENEGHQSHENNHDNIELEDLAVKKIKSDENKKRTWCDYGICDKSDQNDCRQIHENNGEQPRSKFTLTCQPKDQVIVKHGKYKWTMESTQSIEFNDNDEQRQWLDQNNDQNSTSCVNWKCTLATVLALLGLGGGLATGIVNILKYTDAETGNSTIT